MGIERYIQKRDFSSTPEPRGDDDQRASQADRSFVVQKHDASRLHYDFRLELGGVLISWAVPKGPSLDPSQKRLAVHVEDHPVEYGAFEGVIPKNQYGGGTVMLWDRGTWKPETDHPSRDIKRGKVSFTLRGERLRGGWTLTRFKGSKNHDNNRDNWLLIKHDDDAAVRDNPGPSDDDTSIATGRRMHEIAQEDKPATARTSAGVSGAKDDKETEPSKVIGALKARMPDEISPQLCTLTDTAPAGDQWIHEIKFDGYRIVARRTEHEVQLRTRTGKDWTAKFPPLADAIAALPVKQAILDGEATILDRQGHSSFQKLQNAIKIREFEMLAFFAFDLLYLDGYDLVRSPLIERKRLLHAIVSKSDTGLLRYSDHVTGNGNATHSSACRLALEGIISKRVDSPYEQTRSRTWLKVKCSRRQEFVVIGFTPPSGSRKHFGALLLGAYNADGELTYCGKVGTGFTARSLRDIRPQLDALARKTCPADEPPTAAEGRHARWVTPKLVAEVEFTQWTDDGRLRHPSFHGLREDKPAKAIRIESPEQTEEITMTKSNNPGRSSGRNGSKRNRTSTRSDDTRVAGVRLSSPDRVLYPGQGLTKLDLAHYYKKVADHILPHIIDRPLSTVRCPKGRTEQCFYQKHVRETFAEPVKSIRIQEKEAQADYICVDSIEGLIALVQFGVLEVHPWGCAPGDPDSPAIVTFDLDPGEETDFEAVKAGAQLVRDRLKQAGYQPFLKATGGKGLHIVAPLKTNLSWSEVKAMSAEIAHSVAAEHPKHYTATASKAKRKGKVFIDYLRNARGATSVAPYSTRARPGAPVATPLRWDELSRLKSSDRYSVTSIVRRLGSLGSDPWSGYS